MARCLKWKIFNHEIFSKEKKILTTELAVFSIFQEGDETNPTPFKENKTKQKEVRSIPPLSSSFVKATDQEQTDKKVFIDLFVNHILVMSKLGFLWKGFSLRSWGSFWHNISSFIESAVKIFFPRKLNLLVEAQ